ncbi:MAG: ABC transporter ATP-binding protein [Desulfobacca sp.]|uniref:ABC transporter ATP-binding protein n=1 Tax=Desulfobacca sp. TaxID=2067990 RepID=UPI00404A01DA
MISIQNLVKRYKDITALNGVSLEVPPGELFAYLGPNGSGKTTTIRILTGLTRATSGDAYLNGCHFERQSLQAKRQVGLVPQVINLDLELTVQENLDIHGRLFRMKPAARRAQIEALLSYVDLQERRDSLVKQLSGGMKRRVMVARALLHKPRILFLDEPTVGLDPTIRRRLWSLLKRIQQDGTTIFLTTHYIEEAEFLADRVAFLDQGNIVQLDTPANLRSRLGEWAVDEMLEGEIRTHYFAARPAAQEFIVGRNGSFTLRRVNLEDAFIALTGKKVAADGSVAGVLGASPPPAPGGHGGGHGGHKH